MGRSIEEVKALPLKEEVKKKWLGDNAAQLLHL
jgi:predicted TIM-barrel fold metal-dependent hydrolase